MQNAELETYILQKSVELHIQEKEIISIKGESKKSSLYLPVLNNF